MTITTVDPATRSSEALALQAEARLQGDASKTELHNLLVSVVAELRWMIESRGRWMVACERVTSRPALDQLSWLDEEAR